jgi:hypothetical protein
MRRDRTIGSARQGAVPGTALRRFVSWTVLVAARYPDPAANPRRRASMSRARSRRLRSRSSPSATTRSASHATTSQLRRASSASAPSVQRLCTADIGGSRADGSSSLVTRTPRVSMRSRSRDGGAATSTPVSRAERRMQRGSSTGRPPHCCNAPAATVVGRMWR